MNGYFARWQGNFNYYLSDYRRKNKRHDTAVAPLHIVDKTRVVYAGCGVNALSGLQNRASSI
ncbi:hypothetical protein CXP54_22635 [Escherichia albertii]|uniref:Uncharacterized protein n=1 Tax=Escherichia albertii TaxID=208962 RepID=A0ABX5HD07_ESCAL|nr:hypothetical protein CXP54_22635 [Escherichia albertii]EFB3653823.1 hypothetical protein [Escherichia coli]EFX6076161.1 hypothetical protein [Shigella boydii]EAB1453738.1 hypothetical protein [Escherichia albertii]EEW7341505.1 hypothetical protein [Escherichia albertii]